MSIANLSIKQFILQKSQAKHLNILNSSWMSLL